MPLNFRIFITAISAALVVGGCNKSPTGGGDLSPLESFKLIAEKCQDSIAYSDSIFPGKAGGFVRTEITPGAKSFDVKKTDSLVSPYVAYIDLHFVKNAIATPTEEAARSWTGTAVVVMEHWRVVYALQDGKWKTQEELYSFAFPAANIPEGVPNKMKVGALSESLPSATVCTAT